ncbi:MAG: hypothetical protein ACKV2V_19220 [Blastocatellia bacterium]
MVSLTPALRAEYETLFRTCAIRPERQEEVETLVNRIYAAYQRYQDIEDRTGVPWFFVAVVHSLETSLRFDRHLHNGDPLTQRTFHVPAGRPVNGQPPFTWEESAIDALSLKGLGPQTDWSLAGTMYQLERYNGFGYRLHHPEVKSPYLWAFSFHYTKGKYVQDGTWSDTAVSKQCGAAVLIRRMGEKNRAANQMRFTGHPAPANNASPMLPRYAKKKPADAETLRRVLELQNWLNTFPGVFVKPDGIPGQMTSDALRRVTGNYLPGDPRA